MSTPTVSVVFQQTAPLGCAEADLITALQKYVDDLLAPAWGVHCRLEIAQSATIPAGNWALFFADDSDQAEALGYHELLGKMPVGFVFVRTCQQDGCSVSETASHELAELLLNAAANLASLSPRGRWVAREVCDPVQGTPLTVNSLPMANFVLPSWYGAGDSPFDAGSQCQEAWEVLSGGYVPVWTEQGWSKIFGSQAALVAFVKRGGGHPLKRSSRLSDGQPPRHHDGESRVQL